MLEKDIKKYIKQVRDEANKDMKRYTGALSEEFQGRVSAIAEEYKSINKNIKEIKRTLESHTEEIGKLKVDMEENRLDVKDMKSDIKEMRMDLIETKRDIKDVKFWVTGGLKNKVDNKHFVDLDSRVRILEKK